MQLTREPIAVLHTEAFLRSSLSRKLLSFPYMNYSDKILTRKPVNWYLNANSGTVVVRFEEEHVRVTVLQYMMRSICPLLAYGPLYLDVPKDFVPPVNLQQYSCTYGWGDEDLFNLLFKKGARNATSFSSLELTTTLIHHMAKVQ